MTPQATAWEARRVPREATNAELLYDISKRHKLLHASASVTVIGLTETARDAEIYTLWEGEEQTATLVVSRISHGWSASADLIPVSKFFRGYYKDALRAALRPVFASVMDAHELTRVNAWVPSSRARAIRGLEACGFVYEGAMRLAVRLDNKDPEDLVVLGLLKGD